MPLAARKRAQGSAKPVSVRIRALMRRTRTKDPGQAMLVRVREVIDQNHVASAPVDVEALATNIGVRDVVYRPIGVDGLTFPTPTGPLIVINEDAGENRRRFSVAHEICHLLIPGPAPETEAAVQVHDEREESLCDLGANEILMPESIFLEHASLYRPSLNGVLSLSRIFRASLRAVALRLERAGVWREKWAIIGWEQVANGGLACAWVAGPSDVKLMLWPWSGERKQGEVTLVELPELQSSIRTALVTNRRTGSSTEFIRRHGVSVSGDIRVDVDATLPAKTNEPHLISFAWL